MEQKNSGKAVFLDRDGVINEELGRHVADVAELRILPCAAPAIKALNERGYRVIVATNQGGIAKGIVARETIHAIHKEMKERLAKEGARIDKIYYCPHHPAGTIAEYTIVCNCRKPATGMIEQAVKDFHIDTVNSFLIGDALSDMLAGRRAGLKTILVKTGHGGDDIHNEITPDFVADDLMAALTYIS